MRTARIIRFEAAAENAARRHDAEAGPAKTALDDPADLALDDETQILPHPNTKAARRLSYRFLERLAMLLANKFVAANAVIACMRHDKRNGVLSVWISTMNNNGSQDALILMEKIFRCLSQWDNLIDGDAFRIELSTMIHQSYAIQTKKSVEDMIIQFQDNRNVIDNAMGDFSGALDEKPTKRDFGLENFLYQLNSRLGIVARNPSAENTHALINDALLWLQIDNLESRMGLSLGKADLSKRFIKSLYKMAMPLLTINTFVRFIRTFQMTKKPLILYGIPGNSTYLNSQPPRQERAESSATSKTKCMYLEEHRKKAWLSLSTADRTLKFHELRPLAKQNTLRLLAHLYSGKDPQPDTPLYDLFGYGACKTERQTSCLTSIYKMMLIDGVNKNEAFEIFWKALNRLGIIELINEKRYECLRQAIPDLVKELSFAWKGNESVWVLAAFLNAREGTEFFSDPPDCLIRDYGFHMCVMRDEVDSLKTIYAQLTRMCDLFTIHRACTRGRLAELARFYGVPVEDNKWRLLNNQNDAPGVGFQATHHDFLRKGGLFTRSRDTAWRRNDFYNKLALVEFQRQICGAY